MNQHRKLVVYDRYNKYPIVLQHGNNPGLVSHFVKAAIEYIINTQFKTNKNLKKLLKENAPKKILEIGTAVGYSAACFVKYSTKDCIVDTIEIDEENKR